MVIFSTGFDGSSKITLDQETFKGLASETRIGILKILDEHQMTVSDLARAMDMSKATLYEHLEKLIKIGLIKKKEDERKWVYYKLTWKGKSILHPERTKVAIVLSVFLIIFIPLVVFAVLPSGYDIFNLGKDDVDAIAPIIQFSEVDDVTERTAAPINIVIFVDDNDEIDRSSLLIEYSIQDTYTENFEVLTGWREVEDSGGVIKNGQVSVTFLMINWSAHADKYLYLRGTVFDKNGNSAQNIYVEYIDKFYEGSFDISISISDVFIDMNQKQILDQGYQTFPIEINVHNTGSGEVHDVGLSIFSFNPDGNNDGVVDDGNLNLSLKNQNIETIEQGKVASLSMQLGLNLTKFDNIWVVIDPENNFTEANEHNNIVKVNLKSFIGDSVIPEFHPIFGILVVILLIMILGILRKKYT